MPKSKHRKNRKKYVERDASGKPKGTYKQQMGVKNLQMIRSLLFNNACESLTATEVKEAMSVGKDLTYISTTLDENGVPVEGGTETIKVTSADIKRLERIHTYKVDAEQQLKEDVERNP
jgi:hypothetical protein